MDYQAPEMLPFIRDNDFANTKEQNVDAIKMISGLEWSRFIPDDLEEPSRATYGTSTNTGARLSSEAEMPPPFKALPEMLMCMLYILVSVAYHFGLDVSQIRTLVDSAHKIRSPEEGRLHAETLVEAMLLLFRWKAEKEVFQKGHDEGHAAGSEDQKRHILEVVQKHTDPGAYDRIVKECELQENSESEGFPEPFFAAQRDTQIVRGQTPESEDNGSPYTPPPTVSSRPSTYPPTFSHTEYGTKRKRSRDDIDDGSPTSRKVVHQV